MKKEYIIMDIRDASHNKFGDVVIVQANPIKTTALGLRSYKEFISSDTDLFFFSNNSLSIDNILSIAQKRDIWKPDESEFTVEYVYNENTKKMVDAYFHDSLYDFEEDEEYEEDDDLEDEELECGMKYYCVEYSLNQADFIQLPNKLEWNFTKDYIDTPYGTLFLESFMEVPQGDLVGIQFEVDGSLDFSGFNCSLGSEQVATVAVMRRPHNAWLWVYIFDKNGNNIITFCGYDELDGLLKYSEFLNELY